jgi:hypothetical protein
MQNSFLNIVFTISSRPSAVNIKMEATKSHAVSRRARATFENGKAWDLMMEVKTKPQYDSKNCPEGVINLSGALNGLMKDWMADYVKDHASDLPVAECKLDGRRTIYWSDVY